MGSIYEMDYLSKAAGVVKNTLPVLKNLYSDYRAVRKGVRQISDFTSQLRMADRFRRIVAAPAHQDVHAAIAAAAAPGRAPIVWGRAGRRLRRRYHAQLNRRRRQRRRRIRAARRQRAHRKNPYTRHRLSNRRFVRNNVRRRMRRKIRRSLIPMRRISQWYSIGKHTLVGNYFGTDGTHTDHSYYQNGVWYSGQNNQYGGVAHGTPLMIFSHAIAAGADTTDVITMGSIPAFNMKYDYADLNTYRKYWDYGPGASHLQSTYNIPANIYFTSSTFTYGIGASTNLYDIGTVFAAMPRIPVINAGFLADNSNPSSYVQSTDSVNSYTLPYRCYWRYTYCKINYAIKATWPTNWAQLTYQGITLPDNPPLYVRLIGVYYPYRSSLPAPEVLAAHLFPSGGLIYSKINMASRREFYSTFAGRLFFDKTWMFNGRITPQFQSTELLTDGEESSFYVKIPVGWTNYPSPNLDNAWANSHMKVIRWYIFAAFNCPIFKAIANPATAAQAEAALSALCPGFSTSFKFDYFCFPRMRAPNTLDIYGTLGSQFGSYSVRSVKSSATDGDVVAAESSSSPPTLESKGSSSSEASLFLPEKDQSEVNQKTTEVTKSSQSSPVLCTIPADADSTCHQDDPPCDQHIPGELSSEEVGSSQVATSEN